MMTMGFSLDDIRRQFNWLPDSEMPFRYCNHKLNKMPEAVAVSLSRLLIKHKEIAFQKNFLNA